MKFNFIFFVFLCCCACSSQNEFSSIQNHLMAEPVDSALYLEITELDTQVFEKGFNQCDLQALRGAIADDFEFYHDLAGTNGSKKGFVQSIKTHVCENEYKAIRRMIPGSMAVFPLYRNNKLYGAIQTTNHEFYALYPDKLHQRTDSANLFTLWIKTQEGWKMRRSFSYAHISYDEDTEK